MKISQFARHLTVILIACSYLQLSPSGHCAAPAPAYPDRARFEVKLSSLKMDMDAKQVIALLGKPDDLVEATEEMDRIEGDASYGWDQIWCYGTNGHATFPTLGCVYMKKGKVFLTTSSFGHAPPPGMFEEGQLRDLLRVIDRCRVRYRPDRISFDPWDNSISLSWAGYNPRVIITIVNTLLPLGKTKALAALDAYCQAANNPFVFAILYSMFDVPDPPGHLPRANEGATSDEPGDPKSAPRFPVVIVDDVPYLAVGGYIVAGFPEPAGSAIDYFRKHGVLRSAPLQPSGDPMAIPAKAATLLNWKTSERSGFGGSDSSRRHAAVMEQTLRMVGASKDIQWNNLNSLTTQWQTITSNPALQNLRWNTSLQRFTSPQGSYAPDPPLTIPKRIRLAPSIDGLDLRVTLWRINAQLVNISIDYSFKRKKVPPVTIGFATPSLNSPEKLYKIPSDGQMSSEDPASSTGTLMELMAAPNTAISVTIQQGGKVIVTKKYVL